MGVFIFIVALVLVFLFWFTFTTFFHYYRLQDISGSTELDRLSHELESRDDCVYGSVTAGNNVYGSEVVQNVLSALAVDAKMGPKGVFSDTEGDQRIPRIVLVPYDSRTNAEHGTSPLF